MNGERRPDPRAGQFPLGSSLSLLAPLTGGEHARTLLAEDASGTKVVVRHFPAGDPAGAREVGIYPALRPLGALVPRLLAADVQPPEGSLLITAYVDGGPPHDVSDDVLARAGCSDGTRARTLRCGPRACPTGAANEFGRVCSAAREAFPDLALNEPVLLHYNFWVGNTLWRDGQLAAVVDWSGARQGPRAIDLAWLRLDLVLQGRVRLPISSSVTTSSKPVNGSTTSRRGISRTRRKPIPSSSPGCPITTESDSFLSPLSSFAKGSTGGMPRCSPPGQ